MRVGELRHRVKILEVSGALDELGGRTNNTIELGSFWAGVQPLGGSSSFRYGRFENSKTHLVTMRGNSVAKPGRVVLFEDSRWLRIDNVTRVGEETWWLELECVEVPSFP